MLLGISLDDAIARIGHDGITEDIELLFAVGSELPFVEGPPSPDVVALQKHRDPNGDREHWTLCWKGTTFDPACIGKRLWPVTKHAVIDWASLRFSGHEEKTMSSENAQTSVPLEPLTGQCAELFLEASTELHLKLFVIPAKLGGWNWSVRNPRSAVQLAEDSGHCETSTEAQFAAHRAAVKLMRRESERLDAEVDFVEESSVEWE